MCMPWNHKWAKWEQYEWRGACYGSRQLAGIVEAKPIPLSERHQRRHCEVCNKEQDELVRNG